MKHKKHRLTALQKALLGKGIIQGYRPMTRAECEAWADRRDGIG